MGQETQKSERFWWSFLLAGGVCLREEQDGRNYVSLHGCIRDTPQTHKRLQISSSGLTGVPDARGRVYRLT